VPSFLAGRLLLSSVRLGVCSYTLVAHFRRADDRLWIATGFLRSKTSMVRAIDSCPPYLGQHLRRSGDLDRVGHVNLKPRCLLPFRLAVGRGRSHSGAEHPVSQNSTRARESSLTTAGELRQRSSRSPSVAADPPRRALGTHQDEADVPCGHQAAHAAIGAFPDVIRPPNLNDALGPCQAESPPASGIDSVESANNFAVVDSCKTGEV